MFYVIKKKLIASLNPEIKDLLCGIKRYRLTEFTKSPRKVLIVLIDGKNYHGGFCDRFKGIISLYHYCLVKNMEFKISYKFPFKLENYLIPNEYDWVLANDDYCNNIFSVKFINLVGDASAKRLIQIKTKKQIHCYANRNIVDELNTYYNTNYSWGMLFGKLFKPNDKLRNLIDDHIKNIGDEYISAVFRFQQLLGDFREYNYPELPNDKKEELIYKNVRAINMLSDKYPGRKILVTSDSSTFLERAMKISGTYPLLGKVVHIDCTTNAEYDVYMKSFLDFFMLSKSKMIYSIGTKEMYKTEFPMYAAKINNIPFYRITVD